MEAMSQIWNLWHGCHKKSEGCQHCYVFRRDAEFEKDSSIVTKTSTFNLLRSHRLWQLLQETYGHDPAGVSGT